MFILCNWSHSAFADRQLPISQPVNKLFMIRAMFEIGLLLRSPATTWSINTFHRACSFFPDNRPSLWEYTKRKRQMDTAMGKAVRCLTLGCILVFFSLEQCFPAHRSQFWRRVPDDNSNQIGPIIQNCLVYSTVAKSFLKEPPFHSRALFNREMDVWLFYIRYHVLGCVSIFKQYNAFKISLL